MLTRVRMAQLLAIALIGGIVLGAIAGMRFFGPAGLAVGAIFGLITGFISLGILAPALAFKNLIVGVLLLYPLPVVAAIVSGPLGPDAAISATGAILALSALGVHCLLKQTTPTPKRGQCPRCDAQIDEGAERCPECDTPLSPDGKERRWDPLSVAWLAVVSAGMLALSAATVPPALERATLGYATRDPQRLMELMADPDMQTSFSAAERLKKIDPHLLVEALNNPDHRIRRQAAYSMRQGYEHDPEALTALIGALNDSNAEVRYEVAVTLGSIANPAALDALQQTIKTDPSTRVVRAATEAVAEIKERND